MALIKCDECGREISSKSLFCPGCGYPTHLNSALGGAVPEPEAVKQIREQMAAAEPAQPAEPETPQPAPQPQPAPAPIAEPIPEPQEQEQEQPEEPEEQEPAEDLEEEQPHTPSRRNERIKVWLFLGVFLILLGVVLYFYFTAPVEPIEDETVADEIEAVEDAASDSIASDLTDTAAVAAPAAAATAPAAANAPAAVTSKPRTAPQPARESSGEVREIKVAPLSEQARAPRHTTPEPETGDAE